MALYKPNQQAKTRQGVLYSGPENATGYSNPFIIIGPKKRHQKFYLELVRGTGCTQSDGNPAVEKEQNRETGGTQSDGNPAGDRNHSREI